MDEDNQKIKNYLKVGSDSNYTELLWNEEEKKFEIDKTIAKQIGKSTKRSPLDLQKEIEPWLTALFQSERLNLLIGSGLTIAQESLTNGKHTRFMEALDFNVFSNQIKKSAEKFAKQNGRKFFNIEDQMNAANTLLDGLEVYIEENNGKEELKKDIKKLRENINKNLESFIKKVLTVENKILNKKETAHDLPCNFGAKVKESIW